MDSGTATAHVRIWRADTLETISVLESPELLRRHIVCLAFCPDSDRLAIVDGAKKPTLSIWDTMSIKVIAETTLQTEVVCDVSFNTKTPEVLVTGGKEHLCWWEYDINRSIMHLHATPDYQSHLRAQYMICLLHNHGGDLVTGDSNGTIYVWAHGTNRISHSIKHAHDGPVFALRQGRSGLLSGGRDGVLANWAWNKHMDNVGTIQIANIEGGVRTIVVGKTALYVGTTVNSILAVPMAESGPMLQSVIVKKEPLTQGHFDNLLGISPVLKPDSSSHFLTAGYDGIICMFDAQTQKPLWKHTVGVDRKNSKVLCCDVSDAGDFIVVGTKDSLIILLQVLPETNAMAEIDRLTCGRNRLVFVKISPDCQMVVTGSEHGTMYFCELRQQPNQKEGIRAWEVLGKVKVHAGPVIGLDWSKEHFGEYFLLRSCSASIQVAFWDAKQRAQLTDDKSLRNIEWKTHSCRYQYGTAGVWNCGVLKDCQVSCTDVTQDQLNVAVATDNQMLSLFRYPCTKPSAYCHTYSSLSDVRALTFTGNGQHLITVAGRDGSIVQWNII